MQKKKMSLPETRLIIGKIIKELNETNRFDSEEFILKFNKCNQALLFIYNNLSRGKTFFGRCIRKVIIEIDETKCTGCGKCTEACEKEALLLYSVAGKGKKAVVSETGNCTGCLLCMAACKQNAINITRYR